MTRNGIAAAIDLARPAREQGSGWSRAAARGSPGGQGRSIARRDGSVAGPTGSRAGCGMSRGGPARSRAVPSCSRWRGPLSLGPSTVTHDVAPCSRAPRTCSRPPRQALQTLGSARFQGNEARVASFTPGRRIGRPPRIGCRRGGHVLTRAQPPAMTRRRRVARGENGAWSDRSMPHGIAPPAGRARR